MKNKYKITDMVVFEYGGYNSGYSVYTGYISDYKKNIWGRIKYKIIFRTYGLYGGVKTKWINEKNILNISIDYYNETI